MNYLTDQSDYNNIVIVMRDASQNFVLQMYHLKLCMVSPGDVLGFYMEDAAHGKDGGYHAPYRSPAHLQIGTECSLEMTE